jgi:plasmid stabilization system protein ParE
MGCRPRRYQTLEAAQDASGVTVALRWTASAYADLRRIHEFLAPVDAAAAVRSVRAIVARARRIPAQPRLGERLAGFADREVRRVIVQRYELRYSIENTHIYSLRVFHTREDR